ncbi:Glycogen synthase [Pseudobythopirellula maris]|uniref:Glycogen synthase n=1 Tax=Pseudobythopirellula maris TaxID=2527991 RepID=A0A5C5ZNV2_9BACT|nr:glycosyltransferase [Pseudobythopirellula maris]TWT88870.1 Glycogen synthase [Pseudobythopirellula maris]
MPTPDALNAASFAAAPVAFVPPTTAASAEHPNASPAAPPEQTLSVLHVVNGEHYAGAERVQDLLALGLPQQGCGVAFASLVRGRFGDCRRSTDTPLHELTMRGKADLRVVRQVARLAKQGGHDLLHAHTPRSAMVAALAARMTGLPWVYHVHSPTSRDSTHRLTNWVNDRVERWAVRSAARLITVSPTLTDHMVASGAPREKIRCVLNGVPAVDARPRHDPLGPWVLGMVALFRPRKGAEVLLDALADVRADGHDVALRAIGGFETPDYGEHLIDHMQALGLTDAVRWTGFTTDPLAELAKVDALVLPSLFGEGLPMVVLEAMAAGLPVIATRCEGTVEAVAEGQTGLLVEPGDREGLSAAITELVTDRLDYPAMSRRSITRHAERFSDTAMARNVAEVYREALGESCLAAGAES